MSLQLVLCLIITFSATCQCSMTVTNGNVVCRENGTLIGDNGDSSSCNAKNYDSSKRFRLFGIDCCNKIVQESRKEFSEIFLNIDLRSVS